MNESNNEAERVGKHAAPPHGSENERVSAEKAASAEDVSPVEVKADENKLTIELPADVPPAVLLEQLYEALKSAEPLDPYSETNPEEEPQLAAEPAVESEGEPEPEPVAATAPAVEPKPADSTSAAEPEDAATVSSVAADPVPAATSSAAAVPEEEKKKGNVGMWVAIVIAVVALAAAGILAYFAFFAPEKENISEMRDPNALLGQLEGKSPEEIQAELDRIIERGMFNISINQYVEFETGDSAGALRIENVPGNQYIMQVEIARDDTGEVIYTSGMIEPNYHIQEAQLDVDLDVGVYECTATFYAYELETEAAAGEAAAKITIKVLG